VVGSQDSRGVGEGLFEKWYGLAWFAGSLIDIGQSAAGHYGIEVFASPNALLVGENLFQKGCGSA
jgi:hypothetical protein